MEDIDGGFVELIKEKRGLALLFIYSLIMCQMQAPANHSHAKTVDYDTPVGRLLQTGL